MSIFVLDKGVWVVFLNSGEYCTIENTFHRVIREFHEEVVR